MIRGITIFAFFTLATVLVIVLQPGPRKDYAYEQHDQIQHDATRNEVQVLNEPIAEPALSVPDEVLSEIKAGVKRAIEAEQAPADTNAASDAVQQLQAVLDASLEQQDVVSDAVEFSEPVETIQQPQQATGSVDVIAPELRDMSWQTLNTLNTLGRVSKAPGQEGSLLNSIVRRSMGHVDGTQTVTPQVRQPTRQIAKPQVAAAPKATRQRTAGAPVSAGISNSYVVASGDTLALIAIKLYGSALATDRLLADNPSLRQNPNALRIGQVLKFSAP